MPISVRKYPYGNLQAYKMYIRPSVYQLLYGDKHRKIPKNRHAENVIRLLEILAKNGICTTWKIAKNENLTDTEKLRTREKEYRRLIIGRDDKKRHSQGLLELGLVVQDGINYNRGPAAQYRLSLYGILCCIDLLEMNHDEIDEVASKYSYVLPKIFGKWEFLKSILGIEVYKIKILSEGVISDNLIILEESDYPLSEIMSFVHIKYRQKFENIEEEELAEQISFWFYTNLLFSPVRSKNNKKSKLLRILDNDRYLKKWYDNFLMEVKNYHKTQYFAIRKFKIT